MKSKIIKLAFIDTETTGLDPVMNDPFQVAMIYRELLFEYDRSGSFNFTFTGSYDEKVFYMKPLNFDTISPQALTINGITIDQLKSYLPASTVFPVDIVSFLETKVDRFNKEDKMVPVGYNVKFDMDFLFALATKLGFKFFGSYFSRKPIDVLDHFRNLSLLFPGVFTNVKLQTVCEAAGLYLTHAHNALDDIKATMHLFEQSMLPQLSLVQNSNFQIWGGLNFDE